MSVIIFLLILALLVLVHEFGHFIAAKRQGVRVEEFGIGFPPRVLAIKKGETVYSLNAIPLGGFVKLYGEEYQEIEPPRLRSEAGKPRRLKEKAFVYKKPWQKAIIILAGVIGNFLLGWVLISYLFTRGIPSPINKVLIEKVQPDSPAAAAGLKENDFIYGLKEDSKSYSINSSDDLINLSKKFAGRQIQLVGERKGKKFTINITPRKDISPKRGALGILITSFIEKKYSWYQAPIFGLLESFRITEKIISEIIKTLFQLATLQKPKIEVTGPIGIARYTGDAIKFGRDAVLELIALLSLNLAIVNILPFPALDGGRLVFALYEWITKRRVNQTLERYLNLIGILILLTLAILISINDLAHLYR